MHRRSAIPANRDSDDERARRSRLCGRFSRSANLLRPTGVQYRVSRRSVPHRPPFSGRIRTERSHRGSLRLLHRDEQLAGRVWEFSAFLTEVAGVEDVGARLDDVATFHDGCHALRELGIQTGPRRLLRHVRGLELREMEPAGECCGFGGTFSVKFAELSGAMARAKLDAVRRSGANTVISLDPSCLMQIQGAASRAGMNIRTLHLAEVLASR